MQFLVDNTVDDKGALGPYAKYWPLMTILIAAGAVGITFAFPELTQRIMAAYR